MDFVISQLNEYVLGEEHVLGEPARRKAIILNTYFLTKLESDWERVQCAFKKKGHMGDIKEKHRLERDCLARALRFFLKASGGMALSCFRDCIILISTKDKHWTMTTVSLNEGRYIHKDSLKSETTEEVGKNIAKFFDLFSEYALNQEGTAYFSVIRSLRSSISNQTADSEPIPDCKQNLEQKVEECVHSAGIAAELRRPEGRSFDIGNCTQQDNGIDCGIFALVYAIAEATGQRIPTQCLNSNGCDTFRDQVAHCLMANYRESAHA